MTFTTPCFVRVEDEAEREKLIKWLKSVGYKDLGYYFKSPIYYTMVLVDEIGFYINYGDDFVIPVGISCGTNIELFKALAAMNNENDFEQWFVDGRRMFKCWRDMLYETVYLSGRVRKATIEEIIEYFKSK